MAYDTSRERTVLYGGSDPSGKLLGDTWEWDWTEWVQVADTGPAHRGNPSMAFDSKRRRTILFGGWELGGQGLQVAFGDTWVWDGTEWTQEQDSGPTGRAGHKLAYDVERDRIVLFGGFVLPARNVNDTWEYDGTRWVNVADTGPAPRSHHGMTYDSARVLLFGGLGKSDTWEWNGTRWKQLQNMGPSSRGSFGMAYDSVRKHTTLFGGQGNNPYLGDTWEWYEHAPAS